VAFFESKAIRLAISRLSFVATAALTILLAQGLEQSLSIDLGTVRHESGWAYLIPFPATSWLVAYPDDSAHEQRSTVRLFENGNHDSIRVTGAGAFSHRTIRSSFRPATILFHAKTGAVIRFP
jgi:hypothetical protein